MAEDEQYSGMAEDEQYSGMAEDEQHSGMAEDEQHSGMAEDEQYSVCVGTLPWFEESQEPSAVFDGESSTRLCMKPVLQDSN